MRLGQAEIFNHGIASMMAKELGGTIVFVDRLWKRISMSRITASLRNRQQDETRLLGSTPFTMAGVRIRALMVLPPLRPADAPLFDAE